MKRKTLTFVTDDDEEVAIPSKWVICRTCDGDGATLLGFGRDNPAVYTSEDFEQDPDLLDDIQSGRLNKPCPDCDGGRVLVVDEDKLRHSNPKLLRQYRASERREADYQAMLRSEQRRGC